MAKKKSVFDRMGSNIKKATTVPKKKSLGTGNPTKPKRSVPLRGGKLPKKPPP